MPETLYRGHHTLPVVGALSYARRVEIAIRLRDMLALCEMPETTHAHMLTAAVKLSDDLCASGLLMWAASQETSK